MFRRRTTRTLHARIGPAALVLCLLAVSIPAQTRVTAPVVLDRVVAVVNNQAILSSDVDEEIRLAVLDSGTAGGGALTPRRALDQLISRVLIQQQIRAEDALATRPSRRQVEARIANIRREIPACVRQNCASEAGWNAFLAAHDLTQKRVEDYIALRLEILSFIELRFRQGIRITSEEISNYYNYTLLPQYAPGEPMPTLDRVSSRIQEILLQQQVNVLLDDWLRNLRKQGEVEVLDPSLEALPAPPQAAANTGKGARQ